MKKILTIGVIITSIISCEKDELGQRPPLKPKYRNDSIIEYVPYKGDSIINKVGCYYPIFDTNYRKIR